MKISNLLNSMKYIIKLKKSHTPFLPKKVDDKLIRGRSVCSLRNLKSLKKEGVTQIIDLRNYSTELSEILPQKLEVLLCKILKIDYSNFKYSHKLKEMPDDVFFKTINEKILNNPGKTYIHCRHGKRRTGVCVAIYEKFHTDKTKEEILDELYNTGFKELSTKAFDIPQRVYTRLIKIYNNFITKFYPEEPKLRLNQTNN